MRLSHFVDKIEYKNATSHELEDHEWRALILLARLAIVTLGDLTMESICHDDPKWNQNARLN